MASRLGCAAIYYRRRVLLRRLLMPECVPQHLSLYELLPCRIKISRPPKNLSVCGRFSLPHTQLTGPISARLNIYAVFHKSVLTLKEDTVTILCLTNNRSDDLYAATGNSVELALSYHVTTWMNIFLSNCRWDSVCFAFAKCVRFHIMERKVWISQAHNCYK